ncbi:MAG: leucyl aminopeptidase [Myxococcales bacterium]|nr:leucyl aminopeptidase [Myxococcales bacterium]
MQLSVHAGDATTFQGGLLVVGRFAEGAPSAAEQALDAALGGALSKAAARMLFKGKPRQKVVLDTLGRLPVEKVMLMGLGKAGDTAGAVARDFAALGAREAVAARLDGLGVVVPEGVDATELALGIELGAWTYTTLITDDPDAPRFELSRAALIGGGDLATPLARAATLAEGVVLARQLTTEPPNVCTPERLAQVARDMASLPDVTVTVLEKDEIWARGMGGLVAVSRGSSRDPRFIHVAYQPAGADPAQAIAMVGKGITFDSGGLCIKTAQGQTEMHMDMGGAAAVLGAMHALVRLRPKQAIHCIVGACENMPDADAYKPSEVLTMYSGRTVEVLNTDAEGRLVLADAIHYATELKPGLIIDLATLTGAALVALGPYYTALYSDDDAVADRVLAAGKAADERLWRMPLDPKLAKTLESKRADSTNLGIRWGGSITAAQFLQQFKGDTPWCHLDIAGPAMSDKADGYINAGGTGFGVMTLVALAGA